MLGLGQCDWRCLGKGAANEPDVGSARAQEIEGLVGGGMLGLGLRLRRGWDPQKLITEETADLSDFFFVFVLGEVGLSWLGLERLRPSTEAEPAQ
jgi:hypothetical protein